MTIANIRVVNLTDAEILADTVIYIPDDAIDFSASTIRVVNSTDVERVYPHCPNAQLKTIVVMLRARNSCYAVATKVGEVP